MKSAEEYLDKAAQEYGYNTFNEARRNGTLSLDSISHNAMREYALACLQKASQNADIEYDNWGCPDIDKESIYTTDNLI